MRHLIWSNKMYVTSKLNTFINVVSRLKQLQERGIKTETKQICDKLAAEYNIRSLPFTKDMRHCLAPFLYICLISQLYSLSRNMRSSSELHIFNNIQQTKYNSYGQRVFANQDPSILNLLLLGQKVTSTLRESEWRVFTGTKLVLSGLLTSFHTVYYWNGNTWSHSNVKKNKQTSYAIDLLA